MGTQQQKKRKKMTLVIAPVEFSHNRPRDVDDWGSRVYVDAAGSLREECSNEVFIDRG